MKSRRDKYLQCAWRFDIWRRVPAVARYLCAAVIYTRLSAVYTTNTFINDPARFGGRGVVHHSPCGAYSTAPRTWLKFGRALACRTRTARNRRGGGASRPGTGPFRAALPRGFRSWPILALGAAESQFLEMATWNRAETRSFSEPLGITQLANGHESLCPR